MIGIVDYGMGNLLSVKNAFEYLGEDVKTIDNPSELEEIDKIILPGVGAFRDCMNNLRQKGFIDVLNHLVLEKKIPIMGICLGMQVMGKTGYEGGVHQGLGWFDAEIIKLHPIDKSLRIPHVGWTDITFNEKSPLFDGLRDSPDFYFVHSFYVKCNEEKDIDAYYNFSHTVTASIRRNNIFGTQFHPEKSQEHGLKILENFVHWNP
jgi:glutamine amidotransferase